MTFSKLLLSVAAAGCALPAFASAQDAAGQSVQAQWQQQELHFSFMGLKTAYSCDSLEDRLEQLLQELGARPDVKVRATGCAPKQISGMITAHINVNMPVDAGAAGSGPSFAAQRKTVTLAAHSDGRRVGSGDCELLEQVRRQVLPALKLQVVKDELRCFPGAESLGDRTMEIAVLVPVASAK